MICCINLASVENISLSVPLNLSSNGKAPVSMVTSVSRSPNRLRPTLISLLQRPCKKIYIYILFAVSLDNKQKHRRYNNSWTELYIFLILIQANILIINKINSTIVIPTGKSIYYSFLLKITAYRLFHINIRYGAKYLHSWFNKFSPMQNSIGTSNKPARYINVVKNDHMWSVETCNTGMTAMIASSSCCHLAADRSNWLCSKYSRISSELLQIWNNNFNVNQEIFIWKLHYFMFYTVLFGSKQWYQIHFFYI